MLYSLPKTYTYAMYHILFLALKVPSRSCTYDHATDRAAGQVSSHSTGRERSRVKLVLLQAALFPQLGVPFVRIIFGPLLCICHVGVHFEARPQALLKGFGVDTRQA